MKKTIVTVLLTVILCACLVGAFFLGRTTSPEATLSQTGTQDGNTPQTDTLDYREVTSFFAEIAHIEGDRLIANGLSVNDINHRSAYFIILSDEVTLSHHGMEIGIDALHAGDIISVSYAGLREDITPATISPLSVALTVPHTERKDVDLFETYLMHAYIEQMDGNHFLLKDSDDGKIYKLNVPEDITPKDHGAKITLADFEVGDLVALQYRAPVANTSPAQIYDIVRFDLATKKESLGVELQGDYICVMITEFLDASHCYFKAEGMDISGNDYRGNYTVSIPESVINQSGLTLEVGNVIKLYHHGIANPQSDGGLFIPGAKKIEMICDKMYVMEGIVTQVSPSTLYLGSINPETGEKHTSAHVRMGNVILRGNEEITVDDIKVGDRVTVYYNGLVLESYPVQIIAVFKVVVPENDIVTFD